MMSLTLTAQWRETAEEKQLKGAVESGNEQLTATLLAAGAHLTIHEAKYRKDAPELLLSSLLRDAAEKGRLSMAKLLVRYGAK
jgi:hypothetical protein